MKSFLFAACAILATSSHSAPPAGETIASERTTIRLPEDFWKVTDGKIRFPLSQVEIEVARLDEIIKSDYERLVKLLRDRGTKVVIVGTPITGRNIEVDHRSMNDATAADLAFYERLYRSQTPRGGQAFILQPAHGGLYDKNGAVMARPEPYRENPVIIVPRNGNLLDLKAATLSLLISEGQRTKEKNLGTFIFNNDTVRDAQRSATKTLAADLRTRVDSAEGEELVRIKQALISAGIQEYQLGLDKLRSEWNHLEATSYIVHRFEEQKLEPIDTHNLLEAAATLYKKSQEFLSSRESDADWADLHTYRLEGLCTEALTEKWKSLDADVEQSKALMEKMRAYMKHLVEELNEHFEEK